MTKANRIAQEVTQNAASHLGLICLLTGFSPKNEIKMKFTPDTHKNKNGLIQMIGMGKSIRHKWAKYLTGNVETKNMTHSLLLPNTSKMYINMHRDALLRVICANHRYRDQTYYY